MSTTLDFSNANDKKTEICHFIPCKIEYDGEANVKSFFDNTISKEVSALDANYQTAVFRGRPLVGTDITVPSGFTGIVMKDSKKHISEDEERCLKATNTFKKLSFWNLDKTPTSDDCLQKSLQWLEISAALHKPIKDEIDDNSSQRSLKGQ